MKEKTLRKAIREAIKRVVESRATVAEEETVTMAEDSGEDEAWHQWKNEHADDDHIKEIEHHLKALRGDRDYEEHGAEEDHDKYEDEGMEEGPDLNTGMSADDDDDKDDTYMGHMKEEVVEEEWAGKKDDRKVGGADAHEKDDTEEEEDKADYEDPTSEKGKERRKEAELKEEETTTSLNESMAVKKGILVFDKLVKKWCK